MAGNIITGFAPAASAGKAAAGFTPAAEAPADPLGLFGALLDRVTTEGSGAIDFLPTTLQELQALVSGAGKPATPSGVEFSLDVPAEPEVDGEEVLAGLVDALTLLDQALADGKPVTAALGKKVSDALDALAGLLGIALPAVPGALPALAADDDPAAVTPAAAAPDSATPLPPADELDALLALAAAAASPSRGEGEFTPAPSLPSTPSPSPAPSSTLVAAPAPAGGDIQPAVVFTAPMVSAALAGAMPVAAPGLAPLPADDGAPETAALPAAEAEVEAGQSPTAPMSSTATAPRPAIDPASGLGRLIDKIAGLARSIEPQSPGLAKRLDALVQKLSSGEISTTVLAELGLDEAPSLTDSDLDRALTRLLSANSEVKGAPAPQAFAAARLTLPEVMAPSPGSPEPAPTPVSIPVAPRAEASAEPTPRSSIEPRPAGADDRVEPQPASHNVADAKAAMAPRTEAATEPTTAGQPAVQVATATAVVAGTKAVHAAYQAPVHQINIPQVAFELVRQIQAGNSRFQIRLDPPELGRIDVRLDVDQSGNVNARMTVERAETLDLMQRDQRSLERALAQAGLDSAKTNLEFSLRQNPFGREDSGDGRPKGSPFGGAGGETAGAGDDVPDQIQTLYRGSASASGVNLFV